MKALILVLILLSLHTTASPVKLDFSAIDSYVRAIPVSETGTVNKIATYISKKAKTDRDKARAVYVWITNNVAYDINALVSGVIKNKIPQEVLDTRMAVCGGYANLFNALANELGLESLLVSGYTRSFASSSNVQLADKADHAWNVVKIEDNWQLVDSTWGSGYLKNGTNYVKRFNDFQFLTDPAEFIYNHLPEDSSWQMLDKKISRQQFMDLPYLKPAFFNYNVQSIKNLKLNTKAKNTITLEFTADPKAGLNVQLINENSQRIEGYDFIQKNKDTYEITARFPESGKYIIRLFAGQTSQKEWAADYIINATNSQSETPTFPVLYTQFIEHQAYLESPLRKQLRVGESYKFIIRDALARKMAVIIENEFFHLEKDKDNFFKTELTIPPAQTINLCARYKEGTRYTCLVNYEIVK